MIRSSLVAFGATLALAAQDSPGWLLVRNEAKAGRRGEHSLATYGWERLAKAYRLDKFRVVDASAANSVPSASRLVAGTPSNNPAIATLLPVLGVRLESGHLHYRGRQVPKDAGLAILTDDPDGGGRVVVFTGLTERAVYSCISVPLNMDADLWVVMRFRDEIARGSTGTLLRFEPDAMPVVRLDRDLIRAVEELGNGDDAALRISRSLEGYRYVFDAAMEPGVDLFELSRRQLTTDWESVEEAVQRFDGLEISGFLDQIDQKVADRLGGRKGPRPIVHVILAPAIKTNAQVIGRDPISGRTRMTINLAAFEDPADLKVAVAHECVHSMQQPQLGWSLADRAVREGVATFVSQQILGDVPDHRALMWTPAQLSAARARWPKILAEFRRLRGSSDIRRIGMFYYLGSPLRTVPGAPDRCAYYVGWRAARAWSKENPDRLLRDLLQISPKDLLSALED